MNDTIQTKRCPKCERVLPLSDFYRDKQTKDGLSCWCKACIKAKNAQHYQTNKDKIKAYKADYYQTNKDAILKKADDYYQTNKDKIKAYKAEYIDPMKNPLGFAKHMVAHYRQMDRDRFGDDSNTIGMLVNQSKTT